MKTPTKALSLFDTVCIIVGVIIGAGIYETTPTVAACMGGWTGIAAVWVAGGLLAICGALCYAELASTFPSQGGDYVYLGRAYGSWAGLLFGWSQLAIIRPADIALMAFVFGRYAAVIYAPFPNANGLVFTGARISYAMGTGHRVFKALGKWHPRLGTPAAALLLQGLLSLCIVLLAGSFIEAILYSAPAVWLFFLATGVSLFRLRAKAKNVERPFKVPVYPFVPILFCLACGFMLYSSATYALQQKPAGLMVLAGVMCLGGVLFVCRRR